MISRAIASKNKLINGSIYFTESNVLLWSPSSNVIKQSNDEYDARSLKSSLVYINAALLVSAKLVNANESNSTCINGIDGPISANALDESLNASIHADDD